MVNAIAIWYWPSLTLVLDFGIRVQGSRRAILLSVELDQNSFSLLPAELTHAYIPVQPMMFNQGVNQVQTKASILGAHTVQDEINQRSWYES